MSGFLYAFVRTVGRTLRIRCEGTEHSAEAPARIFCGWHGKSFCFANAFRGLGYWVIISHSRDGEMQNYIFSRLGFRTIRGSTGRGGVRAAVEAIKALRDGGTLAMTPDGPRGPSGILQPGVITMAQKSGAALVPVGISARPRLLAKSWDRYMVPYPFARALLLFGDPIYVPANASEAEAETIRQELEQAIHRLEAEAEAKMGFGKP